MIYLKLRPPWMRVSGSQVCLLGTFVLCLWPGSSVVQSTTTSLRGEFLLIPSPLCSDLAPFIPTVPWEGGRVLFCSSVEEETEGQEGELDPGRVAEAGKPGLPFRKLDPWIEPSLEATTLQSNFREKLRQSPAEGCSTEHLTCTPWHCQGL